MLFRNTPPRGFGAGVAGQVDDRAHVAGGLTHRCFVGDVGHHELVVGVVGGRLAVEQPPRVVVADAAEDGLPDAPGSAREEDRLVHSSSHPPDWGINGTVRSVGPDANSA